MKAAVPFLLGVLMTASYAATPEKLSRLPPLELATMTAEQKEAAAKIAETFKMSTPLPPQGPFTALTRKLSFTDGALRLFCATREAKLAPRLFEMTVLIIGRSWTAQFEWYAHAAQAAKLGIAPEVIEAIRLGKRPSFTQEDERVVYDLVHELSETRALSQETYDRALRVLGEEQLVELVGAAGFYTMIAMTVVAFDIRIPAPNPPTPMPPIGTR
jgi:4-carboxymuconolactone decarboxylase